MKRCANCKYSFLHYSYVEKFDGGRAVAHGHCQLTRLQVANKHVCERFENKGADNENC